MYAVEIRSQVEPGEKTCIDPQPAARKRRLRPRRRPVERPQPEAEPKTEESTRERTRAPLSRRASTLAELRVSEAPARKAARRLTTQVPRPHTEAPVVEVVRIDWVRSEDATQTVSTMGNDGVVLQGEASGQRSSSRVARPGVKLPAPGVSVGVDGLIYTIRVAPGDSSAKTARQLADRLRRRFNLEVTHHGAGYTLIRLTGERRS